ncbi:protein takeout-like [Ischnura elegans]|uniref:protein takeout-like n=1 Tax=Ischnura elegans TaxID=197161 RepID=UPI001ED88C82|nr:protein takeout-like [Ischnura elegans]
MARCCLLFLVASAALLQVASAKSLPSYITICKRNNKDDFAKCALKNTIDVQPHIGSGIPELSIPVLDPLTIPEIKLEQGSQAVNYKCVLDNVKLHGLSNYKFKELDAGIDDVKYIKGKVFFPSVFVESDYEIDGKILLVPIKGKGLYKGNFTNTLADIDIDCELVDRKGKQYLAIKEAKVKLDVEESVGNFGNLFNGDSTLAQATNRFINENAKDLQDETLPAVEEVVEALVTQILSKVFDALPYDELFPK